MFGGGCGSACWGFKSEFSLRDKVLMHKTRSKANGGNDLYTPHNGLPRAFSRSAPYFLYLLT